MDYNTSRFRRLFDNRVLNVTDKECWEWPARQRDEWGYGLLRYKEAGVVKKIRAHRLSYILHHGPIPQGLEIRHSCHNPACVNPAHLSVGTRLDNERDKVEAGRTPRGQQKSALLSNEQAQELLDRYRDGEPLRLLALEFDVPYKTAEALVSGRRWSYLRRPKEQGDGDRD